MNIFNKIQSTENNKRGFTRNSYQYQSSYLYFPIQIAMSWGNRNL